MKKMRWTPDIIHCQGWMSASVPFYVKTAYADEPSFAEAKVVTSLFGESQPVELGESFIQGIAFRFIDTAGIRQTTDQVEQIGIQRTFQAIHKARIVLWLIDAQPTEEDIWSGCPS